ncbi:MAG: hypothetical protein M0Q44_01480 [Methylobacter sp.]|jgi:hypothetical protein|nr:hypothetical protein [Methylobacter sp.]
MSIYDDAANALSKKNIANALRDGVSSSLSGISGGVTDALGGSAFGKAVSNIGTSMASNAAAGLANKYIPASMQRMATTGFGALGDVMSGNLDNAGVRLLDSGMLSEFLPGMAGIGAQARFFGTPTPLFGGISPAEAKQIYQEMRSINFCRKNLFLIEVSSRLLGDISSRFNMFVVDLDYSPMTITGEKRKIGAAHIDLVNSSDPVELKITTMDDTDGFVKEWFRVHHAATASSDGTVGLPIEYAIKIKVVHGFITQGSNYGGYQDLGLFRVADLSVSHSRREDALQEVSLSFVQMDTFMAP